MSLGREYRLSRFALIKDWIISTAILAMISMPLIVMGLPIQVQVPWIVVELVLAIGFTFMNYKQSTLSYSIDEQGIIVRELGASLRIPWCEISGIRHRPLYQDLKLYELVLTDGTRKKLHPQVGRQFYADLKGSLPSTVYWDDG